MKFTPQQREARILQLEEFKRQAKEDSVNWRGPTIGSLSSLICNLRNSERQSKYAMAKYGNDPDFKKRRLEASKKWAKSEKGKAYYNALKLRKTDPSAKEQPLGVL